MLPRRNPDLDPALKIKKQGMAGLGKRKSVADNKSVLRGFSPQQEDQAAERVLLLHPTIHPNLKALQDFSCQRLDFFTAARAGLGTGAAGGLAGSRRMTAGFAPPI